MYKHVLGLVTVVIHVISYVVFKYSSFIITVTVRTSERFPVFVACPNCYETVLLHSFHVHVFSSHIIVFSPSYLWSYWILSYLEALFLFLKDTFHLIGIWSCRHYYKVQGWTHGKHMPDTCLLHVVHMYYCALLCNTVCTVFYIVLLIPFHLTYSAFHLTCTASSFYLPIMYSTY